jgi:anaerobic ribonucleoside-triphosphate reductase activating protein
MKYLNILDCDIANGNGMRVTLFVSGCSHHCPNCQNPESWDCNMGKDFTCETLCNLVKLVDRPYIDGLTLSGGDPLFKNNRDTILEVCKTMKRFLPNKDIWLYTGYKFEDIEDLDVIKYVDYIVDDKFDINKRDITLAFKGSSNQRIIDVKSTLETGEVVLYKD